MSLILTMQYAYCRITKTNRKQTYKLNNPISDQLCLTLRNEGIQNFILNLYFLSLANSHINPSSEAFMTSNWIAIENLVRQN